jgi:hypothetical protein
MRVVRRVLAVVQCRARRVVPRTAAADEWNKETVAGDAHKLTAHRLIPMRRSSSWNRRSARRGSNPGRRRTLGLNRSS